MIQTRDLTLPHGITLNCRVSGQPDRPVLVFLHGFPEAAFIWDDYLVHLSRPENGGFYCVAPNLRGYGDSSQPSEVSAYRAKYLVQDILALKHLLNPDAPLAGLIAHDWGGAVAWNFANQHTQALQKLAIINSPHPGTFLRELRTSAEQQAASAYMNFLIRPDAETLLAEDDYRRLWEFFTRMGASEGPYAWLTEELREKYRTVWRKGLTGPLNYYRASPMRPASEQDNSITQLELPRTMLEIHVPTCVIWGMADIALPAGLIEGLDAYIDHLTFHKIEDGTHWVIHEQPERVQDYLRDFFA